MAKRLEECTKTEQTLKEARDMLILDDRNQVPYLGWDREEQRLRIRPDKEPMTLEQAKTLLTELQTLILLPLTVQRFHSTRKMVRDHGGAVLPMMLQLGMRTNCLGPLPSHLPQRSLPHSGHGHAWREDGSERPGDGASEDDRRAVRALRLSSTSNHCYSNAALLALLWASTFASGPSSSEILGHALARIWSWLRKQANSVPLWRHIAWLSLHGRWQQPHRQHDVAEYLSFLRPKLGPLVQGDWENRRPHVDAPATCVDAGHTWPLFLAEPLHHLSTRPDGSAMPWPDDSATSVYGLQPLIDRWQHQAGLLGLVTAPTVLCLQINRFCNCSVVPTKAPQQIDPEPLVVLPAFTSGLGTGQALEQHFVTYRRVAAIMHLGSRCTEGHYRSLLYHPATQYALITDDDQRAQRCAAADLALAQRNNYVFLYLRCAADGA